MADKLAVALSCVVAVRTAALILSNPGSYFAEDYSSGEDEEEDLFSLPKPEPLGRGRGLPASGKRVRSAIPKPRVHHLPPPPDTAAIIHLEHNLDQATLRNKLIDADAARRRAMARVAQLEREAETLNQRCRDLERQVIVASKQQQPQHQNGKLSFDWKLAQRIAKSVWGFQATPTTSLRSDSSLTAAAWTAAALLQGGRTA